MNKKHIIYFCLAFAVLTVIARLIPHPWNFTPMGSLVLFAGFLLPRRWLWLPLGSLVISDIIIGTYSFGVMATVYSSYALMLGASYAARHHYSFVTALGAAAASSVIFYVTTNAAVWAFGSMYTPDMSGLLASYAAAIPFFRNSFAGYLTYTVAFFGVYEYARFALEHKQRGLQEQYQS